MRNLRQNWRKPHKIVYAQNSFSFLSRQTRNIGMDFSYLSASPATIRFKVVRILEGEPCCELNKEELDDFTELIDAFPVADHELEEALKRFPRDYYYLFVKPAVFTLDKERSAKLIKLIEEKCRIDLSEQAATIRYMGNLYRIGFEFPCG